MENFIINLLYSDSRSINMDFSDVDNVCPISILNLAVIEARKYRWLKSMEQNKDAGKEALADWFKNHFRFWYRMYWVEHLNGNKFHNEFSQEEFNLPEKEKEDKKLAQQIINFLLQYGNLSENLGIMFWARRYNIDIDKVKGILEKLKINNKRFIWTKERLDVICKALDEAEKYKWTESEKVGYDVGEGAIIEWFEKHWKSWIISQ